jgi:small subunit ribosomal protein S4
LRFRGPACRFRPCRAEDAILKPTATIIEDANDQAHGIKYKIDRRMGENIWGRPKSPVNKREYGPGQHGQRRKSKLSDYGVQLKAKQKLRGYYGNISERQFRGIYAEARRLKGDTGAHMVGLLERRLDAVVYRAKFVPTVFASRQFINHGHIKVNGRRVNIASFQVKVGDTVEVKDASKQLALVIEARALAERDVPDYIEVDASKLTASSPACRCSRICLCGADGPHLVVEYSR